MPTLHGDPRPAPHLAAEWVGEDDPFLDYCLWPYDPVEEPGGKLRSINQLLQSFHVAGCGPRMYAMVEALREGLGPFQTVWGLKFARGRLGWEFYFYDYDRLERRVSLTRTLEALGPYARTEILPDEERPYFMFSLDLDDDLVEGRRTLDDIHIYIGNVGSSVSSGICYTQTPETLRLDNVYFFFDAATEMPSIVGKIACSAHLDLPDLDVGSILWHDMVDCKTIVVANKRLNEGVYFSRVRVDQLLVFMKRLGYPPPLIDYIEVHRHLFNHMLYDVGYDYVQHDGRIRILKSGYYGVF